MSDYLASRAAYETWLRGKLGALVVEPDLAAKRTAMAASAFAFLRGSYWRWAELVPDVVPELMHAPAVLAVGDLHVENFGTWRDDDGRLVWGVNDFDEAAEMPYVLDLLRLAVSAILAADARKGDFAPLLRPILAGYAAGLAEPRAIVLERDWGWLREEVVVSETRRQKFWSKIGGRKPADAPAAFRAALAAAMPEPDLVFDTAPRVAGVGSLGRPRWTGVAEWRGGPLVREAKALVTSAWEVARGRPDAPLRCADIAAGRFRASDPWYRFAGAIVVRRLSPNNRKIEADKELDLLLDPRLLELMGREVAAIHLGCGDVAAVVRADLAARKGDWLDAPARAMLDALWPDWKAAKAE